MADTKAPNQADAPKRSPQKSAKLCEHMTYSAREAFKRLRTNVLISLGETPEGVCQVVGITSAQPSEGKSTVSINMAYSLAEMGKRVVLLDCDLRRPSIHTNLGAQLVPGLTDVMYGREKLGNAVTHYTSSSGNVGFDLIFAGEIPENPAEILGSRNFLQLLDVVRKAYDVVILDLPPVNVVIDAAVVAKLTDGLMIVIRENHCPRFVLEDCMEQLTYAKANILGFVMNGSVNGAGKRYQYGKSYRYNNAYYQYDRYGK